jgi:hypothetical protein
MSASVPYQFAITDGPKLDQMLDSFKYAFAREKIHVTFRIGEPGEGSFVIESIIKSLRYEECDNPMIYIIAEITKGGTGRIEGVYNPMARQGVAYKGAF